MKSILEQIEQNLQVFLVDDGSTDDTLKRLLEWKKCFDEKMICCEVLRKPSGGMASAINLGLKYFTGKYVCFPDADDILHPNYISSMVVFLEQNPEYNIVRCNFTIMNGTTNYREIINNDFSEHGFFKTLLLKKIHSNVWPMLVKSDFLRRRIPDLHLHEGGALATQEWQLLLPITYKTKVAHLKYSLYIYCIYEDSHSQKGMRRDENSLLSYTSKMKDDIHATFNKMPLSITEIELYRDIGEFCVVRTIMSYENISEKTKYSCALFLAYILNKYMQSCVNIETLVIQKRFFFHSQRLLNYFLETI